MRGGSFCDNYRFRIQNFLKLSCLGCVMAVCDSCFNYKAFGKKCWFYWECKSQCSQFKDAPEEDIKFKSA